MYVQHNPETCRPPGHGTCSGATTRYAGLTAATDLVETERHVTPTLGRGVAGACRGTGVLPVRVVVGIGVVVREVAPGTPAPEQGGTCCERGQRGSQLKKLRNNYGLLVPAAVFADASNTRDLCVLFIMQKDTPRSNRVCTLTRPPAEDRKSSSPSQRTRQHRPVREKATTSK